MNTGRNTGCAALGCLTSVLLVVVGVSRINLFSAAAGAQPGGAHSTYPPAVELAAAVGLTFYGLLILGNSLYAFLLGSGSPVVTLTLLAVECVLGWFYFSVFVLSSYPFMARTQAPMPGLTGTQSKALIMMVRTECNSVSRLQFICTISNQDRCPPRGFLAQLAPACHCWLRISTSLCN